MDVEYLTNDGWTEVEGFHLAPVVKVGNTIHIFGTTGRSSSKNVEEQFGSASQEVADTGAGWDDVVKMTTCHVGGVRPRLELLLEVKDRFVKAPHPAWTGVGVTDLANPDALVGIDVVAQVQS